MPCVHEHYQSQVAHKSKGDHRPVPRSRPVPEIIPTDAQSVEIQPTMKDSHAQPRNINAKHAINLGTLPANVSKENNTYSTSTGDPKHIKDRLIKYMTVQTVTLRS